MLSKIDFLNAITGKPVTVKIDGIEVENRSLTVLETQELQGKQEIDAALGMVVAALVTIVSEILKAFAYDVSVQLSVYVGLIITNCILMGRLEAFAMQNGPWESFLDGVGNGLGYAKILIIVAFFRELFGSGTLLGFNILNYEPIQNIGYVNNGLMLMPPMALIIVACIIWYQRARHKELQEQSN